MPTKGTPIRESSAHRERRLDDEQRRLTMGEALGLPKPHGQTRGLKHFAPGGLCAPKSADSTFEKHNGAGPDAQKEFEQTGRHPALCGPDGEDVHLVSFGERFVELLGEFVDAKLDYAESRRGPSAEYADPTKVYEAGNKLQALIDGKAP